MASGRMELLTAGLGKTVGGTGAWGKIRNLVWDAFEMLLAIQVRMLGRWLLVRDWSSEVLNIKPPAQYLEKSGCSLSGSSLPSPCP